eukprot:8262881-Lingulodinium_polyedra.AAC.1
MYPPTTAVVKLDQLVRADEVVLLLQMGESLRQTVVERDDDVLTPDQLKENWPEVRKAMLK